MNNLTLENRILAYKQINASDEKKKASGVVFLGGFASDMNGTKALFLEEKCKEAGYSYTRFDYRGHGDSSGKFEDGCIGDWFDDALQILDQITTGKQILVGSSMGGWISLLLAKAMPEKIAGIIGVAAAPDFTERLIEPIMTKKQKKMMEEKGFFYEKEESELEEGYDQIPITKKLMEDGKKHNVLSSPLKIDAPVHLLQGQSDNEVPWKFAVEISDYIDGDNIAVTIVKGADHRFSRPEDLKRIWDSIVSL